MGMPILMKGDLGFIYKVSGLHEGRLKLLCNSLLLELGMGNV